MNILSSCTKSLAKQKRKKKEKACNDGQMKLFIRSLKASFFFNFRGFKIIFFSKKIPKVRKLCSTRLYKLRGEVYHLQNVYNRHDTTSILWLFRNSVCFIIYSKTCHLLIARTSSGSLINLPYSLEIRRKKQTKHLS